MHRKAGELLNCMSPRCYYKYQGIDPICERNWQNGGVMPLILLCSYM